MITTRAPDGAKNHHKTDSHKSPRLNVWQKEPKSWIQSNPIKAAVKLMFAIVLVVSSGKLSKLQILPQRRKLLVKGKRGLRGSLGNPLQFVCFHVVANILKLAGWHRKWFLQFCLLNRLSAKEFHNWNNNRQRNEYHSITKRRTTSCVNTSHQQMIPKNILVSDFINGCNYSTNVLRHAGLQVLLPNIALKWISGGKSSLDFLTHEDALMDELLGVHELGWGQTNHQTPSAQIRQHHCTYSHYLTSRITIIIRISCLRITYFCHSRAYLPSYMANNKLEKCFSICLL